MLILALVVLSLGAGCDGPGARPSTPAPSGIRGMVILGAACLGSPTLSTSDAPSPSPCLTPFAATLVILDDAERVVTRVTAGGDGRFEVALAPGEYTVQPQPGDPFPTAQPIDVNVVAGEFAEVQINYISGTE